MPATLDDRIVTNIEAHERRTAVRLPRELTSATLQVGRKRLTCQVVDESSGGFLILLKRAPRLSPSQLLFLTIGADHSPVRVVWQSEHNGQSRLGLQRVAEALIPPKESSWPTWLAAAIVIGFCLGSYVAAERPGWTAEVSGAVSRVVGTALGSQ